MFHIHIIKGILSKSQRNMNIYEDEVKMKLTEKLDFTYLLISGRVCFLERNGGKIVKAVGLVYAKTIFS